MTFEDKVKVGLLIFQAIGYAGISIYLILGLKLFKSDPDLNNGGNCLSYSQCNSCPRKPHKNSRLPIGGDNLVGDSFVKNGEEFIRLH